jgi:ribonuclease G
MGSSLVINANPSEVRVALLEDRQPVEVYIERTAERGVVGNIYRGRVVRVLPGMQAAFVEVGLDRTAFLYVNDAVLSEQPSSSSSADGADGARDRAGDGGDDGGDRDGHGNPDTESAGRRRRAQPIAEIADVLREGQDVVVQVQKEPLGTKGARLTRRVTIPGRHLVYMPFADHIGVSHRIDSEEERERLRAALAEVGPPGSGFIVRTAAEGLEADVLRREAAVLVKLWGEIERQGERGPSPRLIFEDLDLVLRTTRDLFSGQVERIVVDDLDHASRIREFVRSFSPEDEARVELYEGSEPIFDHFGVDVEIERALERRVWLKSGGYIVIDEAEALTVIDVNSGRFVGKSSLEETITQINLEAVKETAYQLRLRNIGGIIIIDFIDMAEAHNRQRVLAVLEEALRRDKAKTTIVRMSELGLVEMTRKRVRDSLEHLLTEPCPYCKGRGTVKSEQTVANEVLRAIRRSLARGHAPRVLVNVDPSVADHLYENQGWYIEALERDYATSIIPVAREGYHREKYRIVKSVPE